MEPKIKICLLGGSGSVGNSTLKVIRRFPEKFELYSFSVHSKEDIAQKIIDEFSPKSLVITGSNPQKIFGTKYKNTSIYYGESFLSDIVSDDSVDIVVTAIVGSAGIQPTIRAIETNKKIAIANKETLVTFGPFINSLIKKHSVKMIPVDSEHNALFQLLENSKEAHSLTLTASGGTFRDLPLDKFKDIKLEEALNHPTWNMGPKITIDSAGMINKGLEVIEAHYLFGFSYDKINVVIHPESVVHGIISFKDGASILYASHPDMIFPIAHSLFYPEPVRELLIERKPDSWNSLNFRSPEMERYPGLKLAYESGRVGGNAPAIFNAANEEAVAKFIQGEIRFIDIPALIDSALQNLETKYPEELEGFMDADKKAREYVLQKVK